MFEKILDFFFPSNIYCMACGNLINDSRPYALCDSCIREIKWITDNTCAVCGKNLGQYSDEDNLCFECREFTHSFTKGYSCATYEGPVKEILSGLKYKNHPDYAVKIAEIMNDRAMEFIDGIKIDMMIPIPMYKKKEKKRGYNQAVLLAGILSEKFGIPMKEDILFKTMNTLPMSGLDSGERRINLHNAFSIGYNKESEIEGKSILLVDDVYTTGSTMDACAEILKDSGAGEIYAYTFASGVNMKRKVT